MENSDSIMQITQDWQIDIYLEKFWSCK